jgi:hypothetical protein
VNKESILTDIRQGEMGVKLGNDILSVVKEFEHYAQVNKRFTDKLESMGYSAWISKDKFSMTMCVNIYEHEGNSRISAQFHYYLSCIVDKKAFTWEGIKAEVERHNYPQRLHRARGQLEVIEAERKELSDLIEYIDSKKFKCFDLSSQVREIKRLLT